jgi:ubiquinol-cytochrome c reductase cytochrome b subunit
MYAALALLPPQMETILLLVGPAVAIGFLLVLPLLSGTGEKSWRRRPVSVLTVLLIIVSLAAFTQLGTYAPWSPRMDAWSSAPIPPKLLSGRSALERQGAVVFQAKQCRNCHALGGEGGQRGPALDSVATRLTGDQLIRQVLQGRGNMPAYGKNLSPSETTALVAFLNSLHPPNQKPAQDASLESVVSTPRTGAGEADP